MNTHAAEVLLEKLKALPPRHRAEAEDFIDFLNARAREERLTVAAAKASEPAFEAVWDNPDDAEYDRL